jgi:hypothetical protein
MKYLRLQPHIDGDVEKLVEVVWFFRTSSGWRISRLSWSFIGSYSFSVSGTDVIFLTHLATFRGQPTTLGQLREERQRRRHGL